MLKIKNKESSTKISKFKEICSRNGIPSIVIANNVLFNSSEIHKFANNWNFIVIMSSPNYSKSNKLAEKGVGIAKAMLKKARENNQDIELYLLNYRNAPVANLEYSPSQLLMNRVLRTKIPANGNQFKPSNIDHESVHRSMIQNQQKQKNIRIKMQQNGKMFFF